MKREKIRRGNEWADMVCFLSLASFAFPLIVFYFLFVQLPMRFCKGV